ncbi:MAG: mandelate racemase/muconate lactonizing enzyme family protein [Candidatus Dormibacteria bacterium]
MKITELVTVRMEIQPNLLYLQVHTDEGPIGLGETFWGADAVQAYVHETMAPQVLGRDPLRIGEHARRLQGVLGLNGTGVETRGNSALDIALWDLLGQVSGQPLHRLLGGRQADDLRIYNTCAGYSYAQGESVSVAHWGVAKRPSEASEPYEDLDAFMNRADELALSLLEQGISGMKIWPFDPAAEAGRGMSISNAALDAALEPFRKIRAAVGERMDIMVEFHSLWNLPTARRIAHALEEFSPYWLEDPIRPDNLETLADFAASVKTPVALSETIAGASLFRRLVQSGAASVVMFDIGWAGGISEARRLGAIADEYHLPFAVHDCTGPVNLAAATAVAISAPNGLIQETVRAFYHGWYQDIVTALPPITNGRIQPLEAPGLGMALQPDLAGRPGVTVRRSGN